MNESILASIKKMLGIEPDVDAFDDVLLIHINTAVSFLYQLGVGQENGSYVSGSDTTWNDLLGEDSRLSMAKTYIYIKVRLLFDPPVSSSVLEAMDRSLKETEWRILAVTDYEIGGGSGGECIDEKARADILEHESNTAIHKTDNDINTAIDSIKIIESKL